MTQKVHLFPSRKYCSYDSSERDSEEKQPVFDIPDIREYFVDLEYVLSVISDGPAKSFAYRRLKYLSSKFTMYTLLNEFQELADMKVRGLLFFLPRSILTRHRKFRIGWCST